jgi:hypothetical protein
VGVVLVTVYAVLAIVTALAVFLLAEWLREPDVPAPDGPARCALAAGLFWPLIVLGTAQWGLIVALQSWLFGSVRPAAADGPRGVPEPVSR